MRTSRSILIDNPAVFKQQLLGWAQQYREIVFLDSNQYPQEFSNFECAIAVDAFTSLKTDYKNAFEDLKQYQQISNDWLFGYLSYELKNDIEDLNSQNFDGLGFADLFFFQPKKIFIFNQNQLQMQYLHLCDDEIDSDLLEIQAYVKKESIASKVVLNQQITKDTYVSKVKKILEYIQQGAVYETTFCMSFFAENCDINPLEKFQKLNEISKAPFSVFLKTKNHYLLSASPERYLKKNNDLLVSQPIKGTSKRFVDKIEDQNSKIQLASDQKERSENIMITDLVRNDLSRTAQKGTVLVTELCKVYPFEQVHQMISTITSRLDPKYSAIDAIKTTFPMGSMTGAPKIAAMQIIDSLEENRRGLFSGAVGYFDPNSNFDFNVVIRSILYNKENKFLSFSVGSAITAMSDPEKEYQECLLKAKALRRVLER